MEALITVKPKILQICAIDSSVESLLKPLIIESMNRGYEVHNACSNTGRFDRLRAEGLTMKEVNIDRKISLLSNVKSVLKLYKLIKKEKYDIVHVHTPVAALLGRIAAKLAGAKNVIYTAHGFYFHEDMSKKQYNFFVNIERIAARFFTDWLLLQSKEDYEFALKQNFKKSERTLHLSNGVDIWNKFNPVLIKEKTCSDFRREENIFKDDFVFSFIGRLVKEKGIFELITAFKNVTNNFPNAKLLIIGGFLESERDQESYRKLMIDLEHFNIRYLGFRKDIPMLMATSDAYILPSYREGLPRSIIEAMAMNNPIIATNIRGCREEVFEGVNGFLVKKGSSEELAEAMEKLLENRVLVKEMGERSREIAEELFDENKVINKQIELFDSLVK